MRPTLIFDAMFDKIVDGKGWFGEEVRSAVLLRLRYTFVCVSPGILRIR